MRPNFLARLLIPVLAIAWCISLGANPVAIVAANGCTPCECSVAYCEGTDMWWPQIGNLTVPTSVLPGDNVTVSFRVDLVNASNVLYPRDGVWYAFVKVAYTNGSWGSEESHQIEIGAEPGGTPSLPVPGNFSVTFTAPPGRTIHIIAEAAGRGSPETVVYLRAPAQMPSPSPSTPFSPPPSSALRSDPGPALATPSDARNVDFVPTSGVVLATFGLAGMLRRRL